MTGSRALHHVKARPTGPSVTKEAKFPSLTILAIPFAELPSIVSVINTATNMVTATIPVDVIPFGVAVSPGGSKVYVTNDGSNTVSVIDAATKIVTATIPVGSDPQAFGIFIQPAKPAPRFAGTPGKGNCYGQSVSALARQYHGLNGAAPALGFSGVRALQDAILAFCGG